MGEIDRSTKRPRTDDDELNDDDIWASDGGEFFPQVEDDDFYGERTDTPENAEIAALRRVHAKQGYLDGLSSVKEGSLQKGFDDGYPSGAELGLEVGKILGALQLLARREDQVGTKSKEMLQIARSELHIRKVLHRRYFNEDLELLPEGHSLLKRWSEQVTALVQEAQAQSC